MATVPDPVLYWNFDESSGTTATSKPGGEVITLDRSAFVPGRTGNGILFDPARGAQKVTTTIPSRTPPYTMALWVRRDAETKSSTLFSGRETALKLEQYLWWPPPPPHFIGITDYAYGTSNGFDADYGLTALVGQWTHLAFVANGTDTKLYVNGELKGTIQKSIALEMAWIGSTRNEEEFAQMTLDEVKVYNVALDPDQVKQVFGGAKPQIKVTDGTNVIANASSVAMSSVTLGASATKTFTITNDGDATLKITGVGIDNLTDYSISPSPLSKDLNKGESVTFTVTFSPKSLSPGTGKVTISSNDPASSSYVFTLSGSATAAAKPQIQVTEGSTGIPNTGGVAIGSATIGGASATKTFTITNTGNATLNVTSVGIDNQTDYSISPSPLSRSLNPGESVAFTATFSPKSPSPSPGRVTISSNDPTQGSYTFTLSGSAVAAAKPGLVVKQYYSYSNIYEVRLSNGQNVDFKDVRPNYTDNSLCYYIENEGTGELRIDGASLSDTTNFKITDDVGTMSGRSPGFPISIPPGGRKILFVVFRRVTQGPYQTTLNLRTNDSAQPSFNVHININMGNSGGGGGGGGSGGGGPRLMIFQYPPETPVSNGQTVSYAPIPGVTAINFVVRNGGNSNLTLDNFSASSRGVLIDGGSRDMNGSSHGLICYTGSGAQTTFSIMPQGGVNPSQLNGARITFRTNDPNQPVFSFTVTGFRG